MVRPYHPNYLSIYPNSFSYYHPNSVCLAIMTHLAASNGNEIWAIVSESGIPAAVEPVVAQPAPTQAAPATPAGKIGKGGRNTRATANAPKTKAAPAVAKPVSTEIVYESGGMTAACTRVQALVEDIIDKFPHTVPPIDSKAVLQYSSPDAVSSQLLLSRRFLHYV